MAKIKKPSRLIFDCDPGCDDALAIALVLQSSKYQYIDFLTVSGNVSVEQTTSNAARVIAACTKDLKDFPQCRIFRGCSRSLMGDEPAAASVHGRDGLGDAPNSLIGKDTFVKPENISAIEWLLQLSRNQSPQNYFDFLCTGPLTNLATAINLMTPLQENIFWQNCACIVIMGGCFGSWGNITYSAEFNTFFDPVAANIVLNSLKRAKDNNKNALVNKWLRFVPLDITETVAIPLDIKYHLVNGNTSLGAEFLLYALKQYGLFHVLSGKRPKKAKDYGIKAFDSNQYTQAQLAGSTGMSKLNRFCYLHDPLAAWVILNRKIRGREFSKYWKITEIRVDANRGEGRGRIIDCSPRIDDKSPVTAPHLGTKVKWLSPPSDRVRNDFRLNFVYEIGELLGIDIKTAAVKIEGK